MSRIYDLILLSASVALSDTSINYTTVWTFASYAAGTEFFDLKSENAQRGVLTIDGGTTNHDSVNIQKWTRLNSIGCTYDITLYGNAGKGAILKDPLFTPTSAKISLYQVAGSIPKLYLDYSVNLKILDKDNNNISGAAVVLKKGDGTQIFSVTTAADGTITEQWVTSKYWSTTIPAGATIYRTFSDSDIVDNNPFTLIISKSGFKTYATKFTFDAKLNWKIMLAKVMDNNFSKRVRINIQ